MGSVARGGRYDFQSHSGEVRIVAVGSSGFELQASSFSGSIRPERGLTLRGVSTTSRSLRATVGDGGGLVVATTFSGDVTIGSRR